MKNKLIILSFLVVSIPSLLVAQDTLTKKEAVDLALVNNYQIMAVKNSLEKAGNNTSIYNSGLLPTVNATANANYNLNSGEAGFSNGTVTEFSAAASNGINSSIGANYVLFNGFNRRYNIKQFQDTYQLSEIQVASTIENVILQVFLSYFEIARLQENYFNLQQALSISKNRLERAKYQNQYGQNSNLDISNALVDVNTDSINILNIHQQLENSKRNLNVILGRNVDDQFSIDTTVNFNNNYVREILEESFRQNNSSLNLARQGLTINENVMKINESSFYPQVSVNSSYGWNKNNNNAASFLAYSKGSGLSAGVSLSWSLFDGGMRYIRQQNALIDVRNQELFISQIEQEISRDFSNAWGNFNNKLFILDAQEDNLATNKINFQRTEEQYRIGRVSSIEFRQAQLNLLNAQTNRNQAKYEAKLAELELLQISGQLLDATF